MMSYEDPQMWSDPAWYHMGILQVESLYSFIVFASHFIA